MVREEYFKKLEARYVKYWYIAQEGAPDVIELAREIAKYTDDEKKVTRIVNGLRRGKVHSIEDLMRADIDELAKIRNIGLDAVNILRQIKCLPTITYADVHPFATTYRVYFYNQEKDGGSWFKDFNTLRELHEFFNSNECEGAVIKYIVKKEDKDGRNSNED